MRCHTFAMRCKTNPIWGNAPGTGGRNVRNEANFDERTGRDRVPIMRQRLVARCRPGNKAKLGQDGIYGGRRVREGPMVQNKPNSRRGRLGQGLRDEGLSCETKPKLGRVGYMGKGDRRLRNGFTGKWNVRNKPNLHLRGGT
jgi:hypothetical protein